MSEHSFWEYLRGLLPRDGHFTRIEAPDTAAGFPDVHYTYDSSTGTIELKHAEPKGQTRYPFGKKFGLRDSQKTWIRDELDARGTVLLALQYGRWVYILDGLYWNKLERMTIAEIRIAAMIEWTKGVTPVERVRDGLRSVL